MKGILTLSLLLIGFIGFAQMVPDAWEEDLKARHPKASAVDWIPGDGIYTAEFQEGDRHVKAIYSQEGNWMRSEMQITVSEVPEEIVANIPEGMKINGAYKILSVKGREAKYILSLEALYNKKGELMQPKE